MTRADRQLDLHADLIRYNDAVYCDDIRRADLMREDLSGQGYEAGHDIGSVWYVYAPNGTSIIAGRNRIEVYRNTMQCRIYHEMGDAIAAFTLLQANA